MRFRVHLPEGSSEWESNAAQFRVGRGDSCALKFEGEAAKYASWEHAEFRVREDGGASVTDLGSSNGTYVDGARIAEAKPLWIGAVVQIGTKGPRLEILELARPAPVCGAGVPPAQKQPGRLRQRNLVIGLAVALLVVVGFLFVRKGVTPQPGPANPPIAEGPNGKGNDGQPQENGSKPIDPIVKSQDDKPANPQPTVEPPQDDKTTPPPPTPPPVPPALVEAHAAYRLIAVDDPETQTTRPYAGAVVVAPHALVTTADVGIELARIRQRGWPIKIMRDSQDAGVPVDRVRIEALFQDAEPDKQLYFDLAILSVKERLTGAATNASDEELEAVKKGAPLVCVAVNHSGESFDGFEELRPEAYKAEARKISPLSSDPGAPRVLFLHGQLGENASGSPIFNDRGRLVAVYCDAAPLADGKPDRQNHYATIVLPALVKLGVAQAESKVWVEPVVPTATSATKEPEQ